MVPWESKAPAPPLSPPLCARYVVSALLVVFLTLPTPIAGAGTFSAQDDWWTGFSGTAVTGVVEDLTYFSGNLIAAGEFLSTGGVPETRGLGSWNGSSWSSIHPPGLDVAHAVAIHQGELYVGGSISVAEGAPSDHVMRWDGITWGAVGTGTNGDVRALGTFGGDLIAGGEFTTAGGAPASNIARWDGTSWNALGPGLPGRVSTVIEFQGDLIAGGRFQTMSNPKIERIARWDGSSWNKMSKGMDGEVLCLAVYNGELIAGGLFTAAGGGSGPAFIARWTGSSWQPLGSGTSGWVGALAVHNGYLHAAGGFSQAGGAPAMKVARWDGAVWTTVGLGMDGDGIHALASDGTTLAAGGEFMTAGGNEAINLAEWDGSVWSGGISVSGGGLGSTASALHVNGTSLVVGGDFSWAGGSMISRVARWDGVTWQPVGSGVNGYVHALTEYNGDLVAAGDFTFAGGAPANRVARWDGTQWWPLGSGIGGGVHALAVYNGDLYAGGRFLSAGGVAVNNIARWDGSAWHDVGGGVEPIPFEFADVRALLVYDGVLVVGGEFMTAGGNAINTLATWNGSTWGSLGGGAWASSYSPKVNSLAIWGGDLIAGGDFTSAGGVSGAKYIARWSGGWTGMGDPDTVTHALVDCGGTLIAGSESCVTYWNGSTWLPVGGFTNATVRALADFQGTLYGAGSFSNLGGTSSQHISRWGSQQVGVGDPATLPVVLNAFPNPFSSGTKVVFELETAGPVRVDVFDLAGRCRASIAEGVLPSGRHEFGWDGRDDRGQRLTAGVYYLRGVTPDGAWTAKLTRVR